VHVEKKVGDKKLILSTMDANRTFGEMSLLDPNGAVSADIITNEETELYVIEVAWILKLFATEHELAERFYKNMATKLARRLTEKDEEKKDKEIDIMESNRSTIRLSLPEKGKEKEFELEKVGKVKLLFGLTDPDALLVKEFNCKWKDKILHSGTLYVFSNCACFYAKIFGFKTKHIVPFINITLLAKATGDKAEPELRINYTKKEKKRNSAYSAFQRKRNLKKHIT